VATIETAFKDWLSSAPIWIREAIGVVAHLGSTAEAASAVKKIIEDYDSGTFEPCELQNLEINLIDARDNIDSAPLKLGSLGPLTRIIHEGNLASGIGRA
jgi:hypothetical protein